jgi:hypothetical protein
MLADAHRQAAQDLEDTLARMSDPTQWPRANRLLIDGYWARRFIGLLLVASRNMASTKNSTPAL